MRRKVARGESLFQRATAFDAVFEVWTGFFKTVVTSNQGREQVTGFQMGGELIGLDGIDTGRHEVDAIALEDSQVCVIPYRELETLGREVPSLQKQFHKIMSREIANDHSVDAAPRQHARGGAGRRVPAQPDAIACTRAAFRHRRCCCA